MNTPQFLDTKIVNENGYLTDNWKQLLISLLQQLQNNFSDEGYKLPQQSTTNIGILSIAKSVGSVLYNNSLDQFGGFYNNGGSTIFKPFANPSSSPTYSGLTLTNLTPHTALIADGTQSVQSSITTDTELSYVHGVTSGIQTQLNGKEPTLTKGNLTEATSAILTIGGGTNAVIGTGTTIQVTQADATHSGYLSTTDWNTFNNKQNSLSFGNLTVSGNLSVSGGTGAVIGAGAAIGVGAGYVIPTTTEESNWNSAYAAAVTNATALNTINTIVKRDANGRTAVSLNDDNTPSARISLNHNSRLLVDSFGKTSIDWQNKEQYGIDDQPIPALRLQINYQNSQLSSWYKYAISLHPLVFAWAAFLSVDWKQCALFGTDGNQSLNWDGHNCNYAGTESLSIDYGGGGLYAIDGTLSCDWNSRYLTDHYGNASVDWENYILSDQDGFQIITFGNGSFHLNDENGNLASDYSLRTLSDGSYACVDWGNRNLCDTAGNALLNHSTEIKFLHNSTGVGTPLIGTNCPATILTAPYTWVKIEAADGTVCYIPAWK
jgi:hypothetical protein